MIVGKGHEERNSRVNLDDQETEQMKQVCYLRSASMEDNIYVRSEEKNSTF